MVWEVEYTDELEAWWDSLSPDEQESVDYTVRLLEEMGPALPFPHSSSIRGSRHGLRELRIQHGGAPYRVLYAFDPRRAAILLIGGRKGSDARWYKTFVPRAEKLYEDHLRDIGHRGHADG